MISTRIFASALRSKQFIAVSQNIFHRYTSNKPKNAELPVTNEANSNQKEPSTTTKYKIFKDEDSEVILDIYEDSSKYAAILQQQAVEEDPYEGLNLERGINGVYEIEDLVDVLRRENAENIFVASVSKDIEYVDYICVVSGKSTRHMKAIAQFVRKVYKMKRGNNDVVPTLEGADSSDWMAIDLGNIALHIFSKEARIQYDLDSLWSVGSKYDREYNKQDPVTEMVEKYSVYLKDLKPAG